MGKSKKIRRLNGNRQRLKEKQEQILEAYDLFDDEISTSVYLQWLLTTPDAMLMM